MWASVVLGGAAAFADPPLIDDDSFEFSSPNGQFVAKAGPKRRSTLVYRRGAAGSELELLWKMPSWPFLAYLSDGGQFMVVCHEWGQSINVEYDPDMVMMTFLKEGHLVATVRLRELVRDFSRLRRTTSHYYWGEYQGFISPTLFALDTVDVRRLVFDVTTGKLVSDEPSKDSRVQPQEKASDPPRGSPADLRKLSPRPRRRP